MGRVREMTDLEFRPERAIAGPAGELSLGYDSGREASLTKPVAHFSTRQKMEKRWGLVLDI